MGVDEAEEARAAIFFVHFDHVPKMPCGGTLRFLRHFFVLSLLFFLIASIG
jgi:hypothetical protein